MDKTCCGGTCTDTQTDPNSCGVCGHSCLGGTCVAGQCQPVLLGRYDRYLGDNGISLGDAYVYAKGETNLLVRVKKDGTDLTAAPVATFATSGCPGGGAEEINGRVFYQWNDGSTCRMAVCSTNDCDGTTVGFAPANIGTQGYKFALDRANLRLFWYDAVSKRVMTAPASASGTPAVTTVTSADIPAASAGYWMGYAAGGILFSSGQYISRLPATGGIYQQLLDTSGVDLNTLWASSSRLYFSDDSGTKFLTLPTAAGGYQSLGTSMAHVLWSDDVDLYWTSGNQSSLYACKVDKCLATTNTVFTTNCIINSIQGEAAAVYWGSYGGCVAPGAATMDNLQIWKLAR